MKLVCVVMKEDAPAQYLDTIALFEYGFQNFSLQKAAELDTRYTIDTSDFFQADVDILGNSKQFISLDPDALILVPSTMRFLELESKLSYETQTNNVIATIKYSCNGIPLGSCDVLLDYVEQTDIIFDSLPITETSPPLPTEQNPQTVSVFVNILPALLLGAGLIFVLLLLFLSRKALKNVHFSRTLQEHFYQFRRNQKLKKQRKHTRNRASYRRVKKQEKKSKLHKEKEKTLHFRPSMPKQRSTYSDFVPTKHNVSRETRKRLRSTKRKRR